ncbi:hypothetical protein [Streptomyces roseochromogenus]|uniref:Uncharacterized protein n=1 Tax=Streptomyces roseochromogenus subsp. oscitans DS 12.976 TaxID=1352936 RepID=V6JIC1_STRRC|nr:hypothetical protein [Streptomyces roseochromogenus]EST18886.1 hypothetical protein M878_44020 [Streptomyces roseochromogenus subsp. oscitans DS 12.976]
MQRHPTTDDLQALADVPHDVPGPAQSAEAVGEAPHAGLDHLGD